MNGAHGRKIGALESIRKFCVACMGGSHVLVAQCDCPECALYALRLNRQEHRREADATENLAECPGIGVHQDRDAHAPAAAQVGLLAEGECGAETAPPGKADDAPQNRPGRRAIRAIRRQCLNCCCGDRAQVRTCAASPKSRPPFEPCLLWRYRLGSRPENLERRLRKARNTPLTLPGLTMPGKS